MGKRKRGGPQKAPEKPSEYEDRAAGKLKLDTYHDVANSEDEFHTHRDKILLDEGQESRKQRQQREEGGSASLPTYKTMLIASSQTNSSSPRTKKSSATQKALLKMTTRTFVMMLRLHQKEPKMPTALAMRLRT